MTLILELLDTHIRTYSIRSQSVPLLARSRAVSICVSDVFRQLLVCFPSVLAMSGQLYDRKTWSFEQMDPTVISAAKAVAMFQYVLICKMLEVLQIILNTKK